MVDAGQAEGDESLFALRLPRISRLANVAPVKVPNSSEAFYVQDAAGERWVRKLELETGPEPLLAEALAWLLAKELGVPVPEAAICDGRPGVLGSQLGWMSKFENHIAHWTPARAQALEVPAELGSVLALDAIIWNEDRHERNLLVCPSPTPDKLRILAIDMGAAKLGWAPDFSACGIASPPPGRLVRGIPVDAVSDGAAETASRAAGIRPELLSAMVKEACALVGDLRFPTLCATLAARCLAAPEIVTSYLKKVALR